MYHMPFRFQFETLFTLLKVFAITLCAISTASLGAATDLPPRILVDYKDPARLKKINTNEGVSVKRIDDSTLEVRIAPFTEHDNNWPVVAFTTEFFGDPLNLMDYSRIEIKLQHKSEGIARVDFNLSSVNTPKDIDYQYHLIPSEYTTTVVHQLPELQYSDPSAIGMFQFIFRPRSTETIFHISAITASYDARTGSPAEKLQARIDALNDRFSTIAAANASKTATDDPAQQRIAGISQQLKALSAEMESARQEGFFGKYQALNAHIAQITGDVSKLQFISAGPMIVWTPDRYLQVTRETGPALDSTLTEAVELSMAGNEFRSVVFAVSATDEPLSITIEVDASQPSSFPSGGVLLEQVIYPRNSRGEYTGDALAPVNGPIDIPVGETRQFWVRFDTRTTTVTPGEYTFVISVADSEKKYTHTIPGTVHVWDFDLPSYDSVPNNSYAIFHAGLPDDPDRQQFNRAIRQMKLYGLNHIFLEVQCLPIPLGVDSNWQITGYNETAFRDRLSAAVNAWNDAPGDDRFHVVIALSTFEDLGLSADGYAYGNDVWETVFAQYIRHLAGILDEYNLPRDQWLIVVRDESSAPALMEWDIPVAEAIKRADPSIRTTCNSSIVLTDPEWVKRYYDAFDVFQPHRGEEIVINFLKESGKELWVYECHTGLTHMDRNLYDYYRVFAWEMIDQGMVGTGVWTYYSSPHNRPWDDDLQGCQLIYVHPEHGVIHSRRYEMVREGVDDFRYVKALRELAAAAGAEAVRQAEALIEDATANILDDRRDVTRSDNWRIRIADAIVALKQ